VYFFATQEIDGHLEVSIGKLAAMTGKVSNSQIPKNFNI